MVKLCAAFFIPCPRRNSNELPLQPALHNRKVFFNGLIRQCGNVLDRVDSAAEPDPR